MMLIDKPAWGYHGLGVLLSNNDQTAENPALTDRSVLSNVSPSVGFHYAEFFIDDSAGTTIGLGLCNELQNPNGWPGEDYNGIALYANGFLITGNVNTIGPLFVIQTGDTIGLLVDSVRRSFKLAQNNNWMTTAAPYGFIPGRIHACAYLWKGAKLTAHFDAAEWKYPPPSDPAYGGDAYGF